MSTGGHTHDRLRSARDALGSARHGYGLVGALGKQGVRVERRARELGVALEGNRHLESESGVEGMGGDV